MAVTHGQIHANLNPRARISATLTPRGNVSAALNIGRSTGGAGVIMKTKEEWDSQPTLKSIRGCIYVYTDYRQEEDPETGETKNYPGTKIGDGSTYLIDLPFTTIPVTEDDIARWNDHVGAIIDEDESNLIFYH